jgi:hypothetical protein
MKFILMSFIGVLFFNLLQGYQKNSEIEVVKKFLEAQDIQEKLQFVREGSEYLKTHNASELPNDLPKAYLELKLSQESYNNDEKIVDVVLEKIRVGNRIVDRTKSFFLIKEDGTYKIDLDASLFKHQRYLDSLVDHQISFTREMRVYATQYSVNNRYVDNKKVLMLINDSYNGENIYILKQKLYEKLKNIFSNNDFAYLILILSYKPEYDIYIVADSLIQTGWIKK